jgi:hypothetical protein
MMVFLPAQRSAVYADRRSYAWVYETTNETERRRGHSWLADQAAQPDSIPATGRTGPHPMADGPSIGLPTEGG